MVEENLGAGSGVHRPHRFDVVLDAQRYPVQRSPRLVRFSTCVGCPGLAHGIRVDFCVGSELLVVTLDSGEEEEGQPFGRDLAPLHGGLDIEDRGVGQESGHFGLDRGGERSNLGLERREVESTEARLVLVDGQVALNSLPRADTKERDERQDRGQRGTIRAMIPTVPGTTGSLVIAGSALSACGATLLSLLLAAVRIPS